MIVLMSNTSVTVGKRETKSQNKVESGFYFFNPSFVFVSSLCTWRIFLMFSFLFKFRQLIRHRHRRRRRCYVLIPTRKPLNKDYIIILWSWPGTALCPCGVVWRNKSGRCFTVMATHEQPLNGTGNLFLSSQSSTESSTVVVGVEVWESGWGLQWLRHVGSSDGRWGKSLHENRLGIPRPTPLVRLQPTVAMWCRSEMIHGPRLSPDMFASLRVETTNNLCSTHLFPHSILSPFRSMAPGVSLSLFQFFSLSLYLTQTYTRARTHRERERATKHGKHDCHYLKLFIFCFVHNQTNFEGGCRDKQTILLLLFLKLN